MTRKSQQKIPIFICLMNSVSGVTSWGLTLKKAFKNHPKYELFLMNLWHKQKSEAFDFNPADLEEAQAIFKQFSPAIVVPNYNWHVLQGLTTRSLGFVGMCHSDSEKEYYAPLVKYQGDFAKYISVSPTCTNHLKDKLPHRQADIVTLPCGIEVPSSIARNYQTKPIRLIYGGRIVQEQKRVFDLVDLVRQLQIKGVEFILTIVGEGADYVELKERMSAEADSNNVNFLDRKTSAEMNEIWASHDVFIQVSDYEGTSVSMLEAMAQGTVPVVTAASSGVTEVIQDGKNGFIVPVGDMPMMASVIENLVAKPKSFAKLGQAAHKNAQAYSIDTYANEFTTIMDQVAETLEWVRPSLEQFKHWQDKLAAAHETVESHQSRIEKIEFDRSVEEANYEYQLSQKRAEIARLKTESDDLTLQLSEEKKAHKKLIEQKDGIVEALEQQISDQKGFIQQLEKQRRDTTQTLKQDLKTEAHKTYTLNKQIEQKDIHIDWLEQERHRLNTSLSMRIGRMFYPIRVFFSRLFGRSE